MTTKKSIIQRVKWVVFLPINIDTKKERQIIQGEFLKQPETRNWTIGSENKNLVLSNKLIKVELPP